MKLKVLGILMMLLAAFSCMKEEALEQPVDGGEERFAEFDPVVRFGLDTYMGGADDNEPLTKTTYAGDDKTIVLDKVRYERINWNGKNETDESKPGYQDVIQIISQTNFTPKDNKTSVSYKVEEISGFTNPSDNSREDYADAKPVNGSDDNFYWSRPAGSKDSDKHYFYAVYPTPESSVRPSTKVTRFDLDTSDSDPANHVAYIEGSINKRDDSDLEASREQKYLDRISYTDGLLGNGQTCYEYLPDMKNAYLYAAAAMPGADAGYKKVPLRFKPLYSAVKLIVTARDAGAKNYRLKRVDLRTDLHNNGSKEGRRDLNDPGVGTALGGSFSTYFKADASSGTTSDFAKIDNPSDSKTAYGDTLKRLYIEIDQADRIVLGDDVLKLTFLVLPIEQTVMTVDYTFEYMKDDAKGWGDPSNVAELHRYLSLQNKTNQEDNKGLHNEFTNNDWFTLDPANKLYVRSNVPEIQYFFDVVMQGNLPRTWKKVIDGSKQPLPKSSREDFTIKDFFEAKDFYAVVSYRDSSGVKQPLRWKVTGYKKPGDTEYELSNKPSWLNLRGDGPWDKLVPFDVDDAKHPGYPYPDKYDPWVVVQGQGTKMKDERYDSKTGRLIGYQNFDSFSYNFYDAGAPDNESRSWGWVNHGSYIHSTPDGEFVHHTNDGVAFPDSTGVKGWKGEMGEAYAYDLSSHDIYGNLTADFNGDIAHATTANCYVVSAPGWYRFPAVYGNGLKNGAHNATAYTGTGTGNNGLMGAFIDHDGNDITNPWIPHTITSVSVVWDDANRMLSERYESADPRILDRRPFFWEDPKTGYGYIYFYVDDIAQGNALIAAKDDAGTIVWSWHIWAVTNPDEYLKTIELQSNPEICNPITYSGTSVLFNYNVNPEKLSNSEAAQETENNEDLKIARPSVVTNVFWKSAELGQNGKELTEVYERYCDVEFTQYFKGKVVQKVVRRVLQSGVKDDYTNAPCYQWGRKDPFQVDFLVKKSIPTNTSVENTDITIKEPTSFFIGENTYFPSGKRYDNLWNTLVDAAVTNSYADGRDDGSKDRSVQKTIYDPSPAGYVVPNMLAFSGLNPFGPISQVRFPRAFADSIAVDHINSYNTNKYIDFYSDYDASATYLRKRDPNKTIRIYIRGRIKGSGKATDLDAGKYHNLKGAYYWTSEPFMTEGGHFFGRCLTLDTDNYATANGIRVWPVAGTPQYTRLRPTGIRDAQGKWQRSHANPVRPMVEQPVSP